MKTIVYKIKRKIKSILIKIVYKNNDRKFIEKQYELVTGKKIDLNNPRTFNEKLNYIKACYYNPLYEKCADKIDVRDYVKEKGLGDILTKVYKIYDSVDDIDYNELPNSFVIKTTHSSGGVVVVNNKEKINKEEIRNTLIESQKNNLYKSYREWQYKNLKPRIMCEEIIKTKKDELNDFKFFCFNGKAKYIYVATGVTTRHEKYLIDFYDINWNWLDVRRVGHDNCGPIPKPEKLNEMISIAEKLSEDFDHVRVDLYCEEGKIYFGELTFTTGAGFGLFDPDSFDLELGECWDLKIQNNK